MFLDRLQVHYAHSSVSSSLLAMDACVNGGVLNIAASQQGDTYILRV